MKVKIVFVGPSNAGKTSLIHRFVYGDFSQHCMPSTQPAFCQKMVKIQASQVQLEIWDTAGQERYHSLSPLFYRDADIGIVTFDLTDEDSFNSAKQWIDELHSNRGDGIIIGVAGNKQDLTEKRVVSFQAMQKFAQEHGVIAIETSARTGENVNMLFEDITTKFIQAGKTPAKTSEGPQETSSGCFC